MRGSCFKPWRASKWLFSCASVVVLSCGRDVPLSLDGLSPQPTAGSASGGAPDGAAGTGGRPVACEPPGPDAEDLGSTRFAVIGDYGIAGPAEKAVAALVRSFRPAFIATTGDNNYPSGEAATIDANVGQYFSDFICPYRGSYGTGAAKNRFFPALGNHDWYAADAQPYLAYFALPGNERYYDVSWGSVRLWIIDSDYHEPDGVSADSRQAQWLKAGLQAATEPWQLVFMHHAPYSSGMHQSTAYMQWPYAEWGVDVVFAGHDHSYERIERDGIHYVVNGLGARDIYTFGTPVADSKVRYNLAHGANLVEADASTLSIQFVDIDGNVVDRFELRSR